MKKIIYVVLLLLVLGASLIIVRSFVQRGHDERITRAFQTMLISLDGTGVIYFLNGTDCKKLQYAVPSQDGQYWVAMPLDGKCGNLDKEIPFNAQHQLTFNWIKQILSTESAISVIVARGSDGHITSAEFGSKNGERYIYNLDAATWATEHDRHYLKQITGQWYRILYHPSPF